MHILMQVILHPESKWCRLCHLLFRRTSWFSTWKPWELSWSRRGCEGLPSTTGRPLPGQLPSALSSVTKACLVCGQYDWVSLMVAPQGACSLWPARGKRQALILRVELGTRKSGGHSIDKIHNHRQRFGSGGPTSWYWVYSFEGPDRLWHWCFLRGAEG